jgi:hypothetical protein
LDGTKEQVIVDYEPSPQSKSKCEKDGVSITPIKLRLVRVVLDSGEAEVSATNLFSRDHSVQNFKELYHLRWAVEEEFKRLKCRIESEAFSGVRTECVYQDFYADILRLNISSLLIEDARNRLEEIGKRTKHYHAPNMCFALGKLSKYLIVCFGEDADEIENFQNNLTDFLCRFSQPIRPERRYTQEKKPYRSGYSTAYKRAV